MGQAGWGQAWRYGSGGGGAGAGAGRACRGRGRALGVSGRRVCGCRACRLWGGGVCWSRGRGCRLGAGWVQAGCRWGHLRGAGPPTPALEETGLDVVVPEHVEQPHLAGLLVELAEAAL